MRFDLPLFPLETVLFPGMPLHLQIFEERYKEMVKYCRELESPFGVTLIRRGSEAYDPDVEPYAIGCTAQIVQVQPLSQGRMNLAAVGQERFRIISLKRNIRPYLVGEVELYPLLNPDGPTASLKAACLRPWLRKFIELMLQKGDWQLDPSHIPDDPVTLAYLSASLLLLPIAKKQELLTEEEVGPMLEKLLSWFPREIALMKAFLEEKPARRGLFSLC